MVATRNFMVPAWLALLGGLCMFSATTHAQSSIRLRPVVYLAQGQITLNDVAELSSPDLATLQRLMGLPLGLVPRPGRVVTVSREDVERNLRRYFVGSQAQLLPGGAAYTEVVAASQLVAGSRLEHEAQQALRRALGDNSDHSAVYVLAMPRDIDVPSGELRFGSQVIMAERRTGEGRALVWIDVEINGQRVTTVPVRFAVEGAHTASMTPRRDGAQDGRRDAWSASLAVQEPPAKVPENTRSPMIDMSKNTESALEVLRGGWALLRARSGAVVVESKVEVLQDGRRGQDVKVRAPLTRDTLIARVSGPGLLEISEK